METIKQNMKGTNTKQRHIYCLEGNWNKHPHCKQSIKPMLDLLFTFSKTKYIYRKCPTKEDFIKQTCEFAKDMGIKRILIECPVSAFPLWKKYAQANGITICIHHHSTFSPNLFADPDVMKSLSDEYGFKVCADIGHWEASGIDPVQALKKLKGNIGELHIKDKRVPDGNKKSVCVPFGEGTVDLKGVLKELDAQKFDGFFVIEYEAEWENNTPSIKKSVEFLRKN